jgi:hypothetical protein
MGKTLIDKLKKFVERGILIGLAASSISIAGCKPYVPPSDPINYAPTVIFSANPNSVKIGGSVSLNLDGSDKNGKSDIIEYKIGLDKNSNGKIDSGEELIKQSSPITNYSWTPSSTGTFKLIGEDIDAGGLTGSENISVSVSNSDIPTINLSGVNFDLIDGRSSVINLPSPTDDDTPGEIPYTDVKVLSGNLTIDKSKLNERKLTLNANPVSQDSPYQLEFDFGTQEGGINTATLEGKIKNLCNVSGTLQDNETHTNQSGTITLSDGTSTSANGTFNIQASSPASQIKLRGRFGNSYIRTITLDGTKDYSGLIVRAVPAPTFCDKEAFRKFIECIDYSYGGINRWDLSDGLKGIEILSTNPTTGDYFSTDQQNVISDKINDINDIRVYVRGKDLSKLVHIDNSQSTKHYNANNGFIIPDAGWIVIAPNVNLTDMNGDGIAGKTGVGYYDDQNIHMYTQTVNTALIEIVPEHAQNGANNIPDPVISHEFGHVFIAQTGEANYGYYPNGNQIGEPILIDGKHAPLPYNQTIMDPSWNVNEPNFDKPKIADKKAGQMIYEESYSAGEKLDDILGMN